MSMKPNTRTLRQAIDDACRYDPQLGDYVILRASHCPENDARSIGDLVALPRAFLPHAEQVAARKGIASASLVPTVEGHLRLTMRGLDPQVADAIAESGRADIFSIENLVRIDPHTIQGLVRVRRVWVFSSLQLLASVIQSVWINVWNRLVYAGQAVAHADNDFAREYTLGGVYKPTPACWRPHEEIVWIGCRPPYSQWTLDPVLRNPFDAEVLTHSFDLSAVAGAPSEIVWDYIADHAAVCPRAQGEWAQDE